MWSWLTLLMTVITLSLPVWTFAGENENVGTVQSPESYVEHGDFYWTRLYWKGTKDVLNHGSLYFVKSDGTRSTTNIWLVVGLKAAAEAVEEDAKQGWDSLKEYQKPADLLPNKKDAVTLKDAVVKLFTKPWGLLTHKVERAGKTAADWRTQMDFSKWGPVGKVANFAWKGFTTVSAYVAVGGVEMPLELA